MGKFSGTFEDQIPSLPFKSDGCSGGLSYWWKKIKGVLPPFEGCCVEHDMEYHYGGTLLEKFQADLQLASCVFTKSVESTGESAAKSDLIKYGILSGVIFLAVTVGGLAYWKKPYSWGFGWHPEWQKE